MKNQTVSQRSIHLVLSKSEDGKQAITADLSSEKRDGKYTKILWNIILHTATSTYRDCVCNEVIGNYCTGGYEITGYTKIDGMDKFEIGIMVLMNAYSDYIPYVIDREEMIDEIGWMLEEF